MVLFQTNGVIETCTWTSNQELAVGAITQLTNELEMAIFARTQTLAAPLPDIDTQMDASSQVDIFTLCSLFSKQATSVDQPVRCHSFTSSQLLSIKVKHSVFHRVCVRTDSFHEKITRTDNGFRSLNIQWLFEYWPGSITLAAVGVFQCSSAAVDEMPAQRGASSGRSPQADHQRVLTLLWHLGGSYKLV